MNQNEIEKWAIEASEQMLPEKKKILDLNANIEDTNDYVRHKERVTGFNDFHDLATPILAKVLMRITELEKNQKTGGDILYMALAKSLITRIFEAADMSLPDSIDIGLSLERIIRAKEQLQSQLTKSEAEIKRLKEITNEM